MIKEIGGTIVSQYPSRPPKKKKKNNSSKIFWPIAMVITVCVAVYFIGANYLIHNLDQKLDIQTFSQSSQNDQSSKTQQSESNSTKDTQDWKLTLVNQNNLIPENYIKRPPKGAFLLKP